MKKFLFISALFMMLHPAADSQVNIIPLPVKVSEQSGKFPFDATVTIGVEKGIGEATVKALQEGIQQHYGTKPRLSSTAEGTKRIQLRIVKLPFSTNPEAYRLSINPNAIVIEGASDAGLFYGIQSLLQLIPANSTGRKIDLPAVVIEDFPRFSYRGMMLDVARHFYDVSYIKKMLDNMAMLKLNKFHWHLTDDQGWRIEIKKYPKLTEIGASRDGTITGRYPGDGNTNKPYRGFYTQEEIKEVVRYAAALHIEVIPEIEMPGHASAAIAAYPFLSCFPEKVTQETVHPSQSRFFPGIKQVQQTWGVFDDVFVPSEQTFQFLSDVIDEVAALFPGTYIHVGGDECPKTFWKQSTFCKQLMEREKLVDEHALQSYFIQRMERHINQKGKRLIGWDEILEGGLAPNATVMSWRGEEGGIAAAKEGHDVVMTPTTFVYFDYSQTRHEDSVVIGGYLPLEKVYSYNPVPEPLRNTTLEARVLGAQANVWTEYIPNPSKLEYMVFPRLGALAEAVWTPENRKSWASFESRLPAFYERLTKLKTNSSKAYYALATTIERQSQTVGVQWRLASNYPNGSIQYQLPGGNAWLAYQEPVALSTSGLYKARLLDNQQQLLQEISQPIQQHLGVGSNISANPLPSEKYPGQGGIYGLMNGATSQRGLISSEWCGWEGKDVQLDIDLGTMKQIQEIELHGFVSHGSWIHAPVTCDIQYSIDGNAYKSLASPDMSNKVTEGRLTINAKASALTEVRFVRILLKHQAKIPTGLAGEGYAAWMFLDEIEIR